MSSVDRRMGVTGSVALKAPCRVATVANITLDGLQTVDGIVLQAADRVLVKDQNNAVLNGIYVADTGLWQRAKDFNGPRDVVQGTLVSVAQGNTNRSTLFELATDLPVIGTSPLTFRPTSTFGRSVPYDPAFFRPTGGGIGASSVIADTDYSHFPQMELGARQRLHAFHYEGPEHGQDSSEAICLRQLGFAGVDLVIDGTFATGGVAYIPSRTRFIIDSVYDISNASFGIHTFDDDGNPIVITMVGPDDGRTTSAEYGTDRVTRITCSDDTVGAFSVGYQVTPGKMAYRYSDDFGRTWSTANYLVDGNDNRGYRPALMAYASGIVVALYFKLDIPLYETGNFRKVSYDNGITWGSEEAVTFTGLDTGDTVVFHSRWRQLGNVNGAEVQVSVGASGNRSYTLRTTDYGATISCIKFAEVDHGADNDLIYEIDSINDGTNTVTLKASHGDVTAYWPANMASTITGTGGANGTSYVVSNSFSGGKTSIVLNALNSGTVGASSRIKRLYGPRQVLEVDIPSNTIRIEGDQTANIVVGSGHYIGFNGFSSGGVGYLDGLVAGATSVTYEAGTPGRTAIVLSEPIPTGTTARPFSRLSDVQLGEWGIGCLTDLNWTLVPRTNAMPSALPRFVTNDGGTTVSLIGATPTVEGSYVALEVDFVPTDHGTMEVISCYARSTTDKFFAISCDALLARASSDYFCPPWYFLSIPDDYNNSGYHSLVFPSAGSVAVMAYGKEIGESTAEVLCRVVDFAPVLTDVVYADRAPGVDDDITLGFAPGRRWSKYDGTAIYIAKSTEEGAAIWTQIQTVTPGGDSWAYKLSADQSLTTGVTADVLWDSPLGTSNGGVRGTITYDSATGWITVPNGGYMTINGNVRLVPTGATGTTNMLLQVDLDTGSGSIDSLLQFSPPANSSTMDIRFGISSWYMEPGGRVRVRALLTASGSAGTPTIASDRSYFTGVVTE